MLGRTVRSEAWLPWLSVVVVGGAAGLLVSRMAHKLPMPLLGLLALAGLVLVFSIAPRHLFFTWLALSSFLEPAAADARSAGRALVWALYVAPGVGMLILTFLRREGRCRFSALDALPIAFVGYVFVSIVLTTNLIHTDLRNTLKVLFLNVGLGVVVYFFLTFGPGASIGGDEICRILLYGGIAQGVLALFNAATGWNIWRDSRWQGVGGVSRAASTLANPAVLGAYLGVTTVIAVAVLAWNGPHELRRLATACLVVSVPGLLVTLTRGPILAGFSGVIVLVLLGRTTARLVGWGVIAVTALVIFALLPQIERSPLYHERIAESQNVQFRAAIQGLSLHLAGQKPLLGWGYGSFDRVKDASGAVPAGEIGMSVLTYTSHNTYLTMLVELGGLGLLLYAVPFVAFSLEGLRRARTRGPDSWVFAAALASLAVIVLTGATLDYRFFSFALMLPWVCLAILRRSAMTAAVQP